MTRYTLEQREEQIAIHREHIQDVINAFERTKTHVSDAELIIRSYKSVLNHIDKVFGKEADE